MGKSAHGLFTDRFIRELKSLIEKHHVAYPVIPPQGIFFESLVERAYKRAGWTEAQVVATSRNSPKHDLMVGAEKMSLKTETGPITRENLISITKLCTTEREPWDSPTLIGHAMDHLSRYDYMLMLRAIWKPGSIHYQLVDIPIELLKRIGTVVVTPVGRRTGRASLAADIHIRSEVAFHVHFDGADGKCQIRNLPVSRCRMLLKWDQTIVEEGLTLLTPE